MSQRTTRNGRDSSLEFEPARELPRHALAKRTRRPVMGVFVLLGATLCLVAWTVQRLMAESHARPLAASSALPQQDLVRPKTHDALASVTVTRPIALELQPSVLLEGSLAPQQTTSLAFTVGGTLNRLSVQVGDKVKAGARLAQLEATTAAAQFAMTAARVKAATAQLTLALDTAERSTELAATGSLNAAGAVDSQLRSSMAAAELEATRAQHAQAQIVLQEHTLRAPFTGTVITAPDAVGGVVSAGAPLFKLADLASLKFNSTVSESDAKLLAAGVKITIDSASGPVAGRITKVHCTLEEQTRRVPVEAVFDAPGPLRAGAFVKARAQPSGPVHVLRLPATALRPGTSDEVMIVEPGYNTTLAVRRIDNEVEPSGTLLVRGGLRAEDVVVANPEADAKAGDIVVITDSASLAQEPR